MKKIFKYALGITDSQQVRVPMGAQLLAVQVQRGELFLWALVDNDLSHLLSLRTIHIYGTGHEIHREDIYLGTVQMDAGNLVFHVFVEAL